MLHISRFVIPMLVILALILTACQPTTPQVEVTQEATVEATTAPPVIPAEGETIRIGGIGPLSAPGDVVGGIAMQYAMGLAVQDINAQGGVLGRQVELVFADTEAVGLDALEAIGRLRDLGVPSFLIGATLTGVVAQRLVRQVCPSCAAGDFQLCWNFTQGRISPGITLSPNAMRSA